MKFLKPITLVFVFIILTILTQIGGIILLATLPFFRLIDHKVEYRFARLMLKPTAFIGLYLLATFAIVPHLAKPLGRVPLPVTGNDHIEPLTMMTCVLNRHYVKPELLESLDEVAREMNGENLGTTVAYLDANFPFIDGFPLLPHLSHNDGGKLDLAFLYKDNETGESLNDRAPSPIGYGVYEGPLPGEYDQPNHCRNNGYWQYGILGQLVPDWSGENMVLDEERTRKLIKLLASNERIGKIFIEPHLKNRLNLTNEKVRFHGCHAVRHDDHVHVEL